MSLRSGFGFALERRRELSPVENAATESPTAADPNGAKPAFGEEVGLL